jgi:hypothetical protein
MHRAALRVRRLGRQPHLFWVHPAEARAMPSWDPVTGLSGWIFQGMAPMSKDGMKRPLAAECGQTPDGPLAHRRSEYPLPGCVPAEPDSVSPPQQARSRHVPIAANAFGHRTYASENPRQPHRWGARKNRMNPFPFWTPDHAKVGLAPQPTSRVPRTLLDKPAAAPNAFALTHYETLFAVAARRKLGESVRDDVSATAA